MLDIRWNGKRAVWIAYARGCHVAEFPNLLKLTEWLGMHGYRQYKILPPLSEHMTRHYNVYKASMYIGPTQVKQWANRARLHFAGCPVFAGTERVWIHGIKAASIYDVEHDMHVCFPRDRGFSTGLILMSDDALGA